jgi:hypothetical protein
MHRRLSTFVKSASSSSSPAFGEKIVEDDAQSVSSTVVRDEPAPVPSLKVKRVDYYYSRWTRAWKYKVSFLHILFIRYSVID